MHRSLVRAALVSSVVWGCSVVVEPDASRGPAPEPRGGGSPEDAATSGDAGSALESEAGAGGDSGLGLPPPTYTPTRYVTVSASGAGDGSLANPWTLAQAMANAVAGDRVQVGPGIYTGTNTASRSVPAFNPANSGTAASPIVFFAQHPAVHSATNRSEIRNGVTMGELGCPTIGTSNRDYIVWDGFYIDEQQSRSHSDTGPVVIWSSSNVEIARSLVNGRIFVRGDNHSGIRTEGAINPLIRYNRIQNFRDPTPARNTTAFTMYDTRGLVFEHNDLVDNDSGLYLKGQHEDAVLNAEADVRFNRIVRNHAALGRGITGVVALGLTDTTLPGIGRSHVHQNIIVGYNNSIATNAVAPNHPRLVGFYNNTVYDCGVGIGILQSTSGDGYRDTFFRRNLSSNTTHGIYSETVSAAGFVAYQGLGFDIDDNWFHQYGTFANTSAGALTLAAWRTQTGFDMASNEGDPQFVNAAAGDFHLQPGSPARTAATGGGPVGAYITGTETIGVGSR